MPGSPAWLTASQAAARLHVSPKTVSRWATQAAFSTDEPWAAIAALTPS